MKLFACILSIIVLALTVVPCIDKHDGNSLQKTELSQHNNSNHQEDIGHCSPFCTCQCCQTNCHITEIISSAPFVELTISFSHYPSHFEDPELFDFLIPPRV